MKRMLCGLAAWASLALSAQADNLRPAPFLNFSVTADAQDTTSVIFYGGPDADNKPAPLIGSNVFVSTVVGLHTDVNEHVLLQLYSGTGDSMTNAGVLNFQTGPFRSFHYDPYVTDDDGNIVGGTGVGRWNFSRGGSITIVGRTDPDDSVPDKALLSGHFIGTPYVTHTDDDTSFKVLLGVFVDDIDPDLADFYGMPRAKHRGTIDLSFYAQLPDDGSFGDNGPPDAFPGDPFISSTIGNGAVLSLSPVAEPTSATLAVIGLAGLVGYGWRYRRSRGRLQG